MELREFVSIYKGGILFTVKESMPDKGGMLKTVISFSNGEHEALREDLLSRKIRNFYIEPNNTSRNAELVIILADAVEGE